MSLQGEMSDSKQGLIIRWAWAALFSKAHGGRAFPPFPATGASICQKLGVSTQSSGGGSDTTFGGFTGTVPSRQGTQLFLDPY